MSSTNGETGSERKPTILIVDDEPDLLDVLEAYLRDDGFNTVRAEDGRAAVDSAFREKPDLILLDLNLPKKDGREVLSEIKQDEALKVIPVVVITTSKSDEDILKSYNLHANCYITKPIDLEQFMIVVRAIESFWLTIVKLPPDESR